MTHYRGFDIDKYFNIYKDGKQTFTAHWLNCCTMQEAEKLIDNSLGAKAKFAKMPDKQKALQSLGDGEGRTMLEWMDQQHEKQLEEKWK